MNEVFGIVVDMKAAHGYIEYCRFFMPGDLEITTQTFEQLLGLPDINNDLPLRLCLVRLDHMPFEVLAVRYCRLDELAWNCRLITRDIFKYHNLEK